MNWLDAIFIVLLVLGAIRGLLTGKMISLLIIFAIWVISIAIAVNFEEQLGDTFGDYHWYPLLAFFIILGVIQAIIYWSGIPLMLINSIGWRPTREQGMVGAMLLSACVTAIYCGLIWRILWEIAVAVTRTSGFTVEGSGAASTYYNLIEGSATRSGFVAFVDWFEPPRGVIIGCVLGAALVGLAAAGRLRGEQAEIEDLTEDYSDQEGPPENGGGTKTESQ
jgi:hypothetical protein